MASTPLRSLLDPARFESQGKRQNIQAVFQLSLTGQDIYDILQLLEGHAVNNPSLLDVCASVLAADRLRESARDAGW